MDGYTRNPNKHLEVTSVTSSSSDDITSNEMVLDGELWEWIQGTDGVWTPVRVGPEKEPTRLPQDHRTMAEIWREQGRCGKCGRDREFSHFVLVCPVHGEDY